MKKTQVLLILFIAIASARCSDYKRYKRTIYPFRNWGNTVSPSSGQGVQSPPPTLLRRGAQLASQPPPRLPLPNAQYPIYKIHRYNGIHVKPVPAQEVVPKIIKSPSPPSTVETIKALINSNISTDAIKSLVELASHKDGLRVIMSLIDSDILNSEKHIKQVPAHHSTVYGPPDNSFMSSSFKAPASNLQKQYGIPNGEVKFRPIGSHDEKPPGTSYGYPDNRIETQGAQPIKNILPFKRLPELPALPDAQLFETATHINPFPGQTRVVYNVKSVQHVPVPHNEIVVSKHINTDQNTFSNINPIVVAQENVVDSYEINEISDNILGSASETHEIVVDKDGHPINITLAVHKERGNNFPTRKRWSPNTKQPKNDTVKQEDNHTISS